MGALTQKDKSISIKTQLGDDALLLQSISGSEYISKPFHFQLELLAESNTITAKDLIGTTVDVDILLSDRSSTRTINGHVSRFVAGPIHENGYRIYQAEIVPWFYLLRLYNDCRIFQNKTAKDIIEEVFSSRGFSAFSFDLTRTCATREYCAQYRESDFQFVSRLMEEEGIFYYFTHVAGKHTMVISDSATGYETCGESEARYFEAGMSDDHLTRWDHQFSVIPGKWSQTDFNFTTPATDISTTINTVVDLTDITNYEQYDYPGLYVNRGDGDALTKIRIEEEETSHEIVLSTGSYRTFTAGSKFKLTLHEIAEEKGKEYVITAISHYAREASYTLSDSGASEYQNNFECIPSDKAYRPKRITPKPFVQGPQTAFVVGPSGEEIYVDEYGRIKVQFHWDRVGQKDENSSCWLRVSQQWAGKNWGAVFTPRIGHEVIVSFLEGDPDRPLVTGSVYNADNMPPYELPANKTQSGWKSRSTKSGGTSNFNEFRFEDKKGSEEIYIHAEKDQNNIVENDETTNVGNDRTEDVGNNEKITIGVNRIESVGTDEEITIGNNRTESVGKNENISIGENRSENVGKNEDISIGENRSVEVGKDESISIASNQEIQVGKKQDVSVGDSRNIEVGKDDTLNVSKKLNIIAGDQITLKCGKSSIVLKKDGKIEIKGKELNVKMSGNIKMKGSKIAQN